jgi:ubiquinol-cytochrome c reductase cytochrome b subunit
VGCAARRPRRSPVFWAGPGFLPILFVLAAVYPWVERRLTGDDAAHHLLQRPRDASVRTSLGVMALAFSTVLVLCDADDVIAYHFDVSLDALVREGRIGVLVVPPIAYRVTYRVCLGLQRSDRAVLEHGIETGIVRRLPHGGFLAVYQPLCGVDEQRMPSRSSTAQTTAVIPPSMKRTWPLT